MSRMLLNLRGVPDEEARGLREALDESGILWYEVPPSRWLISAGSIWIRDRDDWPRAREVIDAFQEEYVAQARSEPPLRFIDTLRARPAATIGYIFGALFMLWLLFWPVLHLAI